MTNAEKKKRIALKKMQTNTDKASNSLLSSKRTVQSRSWTFSSNVTITLSQHLFTERRPLPACTQNGTP